MDIQRKIILALVCLLAFSFKNNTESTVRFVVRDMYGDTIVVNYKKAFVTLLKEPSCTGCKIELLKHMIADKKVYFLVLGWQPDLLRKKVYEKYLLAINPKLKIYYSLNDNEIIFKANNETVENKTKQFPYQIFVSMQNNSLNIKKKDYDLVFNDIFVSEFYKKELKSFLKK